MYPRKHRLAKKTDIDRAWKKGRSFATPLFSLKVAKNDLPVSRFAVVVGLKASKRAVVRNTAKRRVREAIRALLPQIAPGYDVLVLGRPKLTEATLTEVGATLRFALEKTGLVRRAL